MAKRRDKASVHVDSLCHKDKRVNIPTEELRDFVAEYEAKPKTVLYPRDPPLTRNLSGKERTSRMRKTWLFRRFLFTSRRKFSPRPS